MDPFPFKESRPTVGKPSACGVQVVPMRKRVGLGNSQEIFLVGDSLPAPSLIEVSDEELLA